jgi:hypothetical protein
MGKGEWTEVNREISFFEQKIAKGTKKRRTAGMKR